MTVELSRSETFTMTRLTLGELCDWTSCGVPLHHVLRKHFLLINASCDLRRKKTFDYSLQNFAKVTKHNVKNIFAVNMEGRGLCLLVFPNWRVSIRPVFYIFVLFLVIAGLLERQLLVSWCVWGSHRVRLFWLLAAPKFKNQINS